MSQLKKYFLEFKKTIDYVKKLIGCGHALSKELLKSTDFTKGDFFTLLPSGLSNSDLYNFEYEGDFGWKDCERSQNIFSGEKSLTDDKLTLVLSNYIMKKIIKNNELSWIFEDVDHFITDPHLELFHSHGLANGKNIYYLVNSANANYDLISNCVWKSGSTWRSVCVLTKTSFDYIADKNLSLNKIKEACVNTESIVIGAYDMCGYIFWEKIKK